jgi:hypothetical protein
VQFSLSKESDLKTYALHQIKHAAKKKKKEKGTYIGFAFVFSFLKKGSFPSNIFLFYLWVQLEDHQNHWLQ